MTRGLEAQLRAAGARHRAAEERVTSLGDRVSTARSSARAAEAAVDGALARARALRNSARAAQSEVLTAQERVTASEAEVAQAAANLEAAADLHRRRQELLRDGAIAERSVTEARTALAAAEAALRAARSRVETSRQAVATARASADAAQSQAEDAESAVETARANASAAQSGVGEAQNAVAEAKRQVDAARADVDALRSQLQQARRGSRAVDVEPVRTEVRTQEATVRWFRRELAKYTVLSPVNGRVTDRPVDPGDYTAPGTRIFTVANEQRIYIRADVDEADIAGVRLGSPVRFQVDAEPGRTYTGRVSLIGRAADRGTKTYPVEIRDLSEVQGLKIGMTADVNIQGRDTPDAVVVSSDALQTDGAQTLVWVLEGDRVKRRPVRIKAKDAGSVQILEGLRAGEQVVLNPAGLSDGRQVRVAGR